VRREILQLDRPDPAALIVEGGEVVDTGGKQARAEPTDYTERRGGHHYRQRHGGCAHRCGGFPGRPGWRRSGRDLCRTPGSRRRSRMRAGPRRKVTSTARSPTRSVPTCVELAGSRRRENDPGRFRCCHGCCTARTQRCGFGSRRCWRRESCLFRWRQRMAGCCRAR
jgi:hypothetical protein